MADTDSEPWLTDPDPASEGVASGVCGVSVGSDPPVMGTSVPEPCEFEGVTPVGGTGRSVVKDPPGMVVISPSASVEVTAGIGMTVGIELIGESIPDSEGPGTTGITVGKELGGMVVISPPGRTVVTAGIEMTVEMESIGGTIPDPELPGSGTGSTEVSSEVGMVVTSPPGSTEVTSGIGITVVKEPAGGRITVPVFSGSGRGIVMEPPGMMVVSPFGSKVVTDGRGRIVDSGTGMGGTIPVPEVPGSGIIPDPELPGPGMGRVTDPAGMMVV